LVVFRRSNRNRPLPYPAAAFGYRTRDVLWDDSVIVLNRQNAEVLFADLTWHREPNEILDRLRAVTERERMDNAEDDLESSRYVHAHTGPPVFEVHPPATIAAGSSIAGNVYCRVYLPVDQDLRRLKNRSSSCDGKHGTCWTARAMTFPNRRSAVEQNAD